MRQIDIPADYPPRLQNSGIVVGSATSLPDEKWSPPWQEMSSYFFGSAEGPKVIGVIRSGGSNTLSGWDEQACDADGLEKQCGRLFALELPAGKYQIGNVRVNDLGSRHAIYPVQAYSQSLSDFYFTVVAGEVRYLGNLQSQICIGAAGNFGKLEVWAVRGEVRDDYIRDWALLVEKYPALDKLPVEKALIQTQPWLWMRPKPAPAEQWPQECGPYPHDAGH